MSGLVPGSELEIVEIGGPEAGLFSQPELAEMDPRVKLYFRARPPLASKLQMYPDLRYDMGQLLIMSGTWRLDMSASCHRHLRDMCICMLDST